MNKTFLNYAVAFLSSVVIFFAFSGYLLVRREVFDLHIANKVLATTALTLLEMVLFIGPLARIFDVFDSWLKYRKELGLLAFMYGALHSYLSYFGLSDHFPRSNFHLGNAAFLFGLSGFLVLLVLFILSFDVIIQKLNRRIWWSLQNWGVRISFFLFFFHIFLLKYQGWVGWFMKGGGPELVRPYLPPLSLLGTLFMLMIVLTRLVDRCTIQNKRQVTLIVFGCFVLSYIFLVTYGIGFYF